MRVIIASSKTGIVSPDFGTHLIFHSSIKGKLNNTIHLEKVSLSPPKGLFEFLKDLGDGENGISGTMVHDGSMSLQEYLQGSCDAMEEPKLKPGYVPQTLYWVLIEKQLRPRGGKSSKKRKL